MAQPDRLAIGVFMPPNSHKLTLSGLVFASSVHLSAMKILVDRIKDKQSSKQKFDHLEMELKRAKQHVYTLDRVASLNLSKPLNQSDMCYVHNATIILGVELIEPHALAPLTDDDITSVKKISKDFLANVELEAKVLQFKLDKHNKVNRESYSSTHVADDHSEYYRVREKATMQIARLARAQFEKLHDQLTAFAKPPMYSPEDEARMRDAREREFLDTSRLMAIQVGALRARADLLAKFRWLENPDMSEHRQSLAWLILDEPRSPAPSVHAFNAFDGARVMPEVQAARAAELMQVGPIQIGRPVKVDWLPSVDRDDRVATSLSTNAVLCIGGEIASMKLTVVHLLSHRFVEIECSEAFIHGFVYKGELFVAQSGHAMLWQASVAAVLAGCTALADFETFALAAEWGTISRLDAAPAGHVVATNNRDHSQHIFVDLAARESHLVKIGQDMFYIGGSSGIEVPGMYYVTTKGSTNSPLYAMARTGKMEKISDKVNSYPRVQPSCENPCDVSCAAIFEKGGYFTVGGKRGRLKDPVCPSYQSLVRVHRDVCLCWDRGRSSWFMLRILVP